MTSISSSSPNAPDACALVPTESLVPGVEIELALLLVQAVKARRKLLSKSSSPSNDDDGAGRESLHRDLLRNLLDAADDKAAAFLNELKRQVQSKSYRSASASSSSRRGGTNKSSPADAPVRCVEFLLDITSNESDSFHLRRSALALTREILVRSSGARASFACGRCLLNFARAVGGVENVQAGGDGGNGGASRGGSDLSPRSLFQLEAMELVHDLASKFGKFYPQFTVASRLLGDVSINFSMHRIIRDAANNSGDAQNLGLKVCHSQNANMRSLRRVRDNALECGLKACQSLVGMVERADEYFRILVPRFGGFNGKSLEKLNKPESAGVNISEISAIYNSKLADNIDGFASNDYKDGDDHYGEDDDDSSIDWEDGDIELIHHRAAVTHTLEVMERSGAILEGSLAIQFRGGKSIELLGPSGFLTTDQDQVPVEESAAVARRKLQNLVEKLSRRLTRLNQWIFALSHADGMKERTVLDPITARPLVSLVLLSEEKLAVRSKLLQRMIKMRGEVEGVICSSTKLGIALDESGTKMRSLGNDGDTARVNGVGCGTVTGVKRPWTPPGSETLAAFKKRKNSKISRFNVIYRKK